MDGALDRSDSPGPADGAPKVGRSSGSARPPDVKQGWAGVVSGLAFAAALGVAAIVVQTVLLRELSLLWFGSEISYALTLAAWLVGASVGATASGLAMRKVPPTAAAAIAGLGFALYAVTATHFLRAGGPLMEIGLGEIVPPGQMLLYTIATAGGSAFWIGAMFPAGCALTGLPDPRRAIGTFFLVDALGMLAGALAMTFWLIGWADPTGLVAAAGGILLLALIDPCRRARQRAARRGLSIPAAACMLGGLFWSLLAFSTSAADMDAAARTLRWRRLAPEGMTHLAEVQSPYGRIDLGELGGEWTLYLNGKPAVTMPDPYLPSRVHLAACQPGRLRRAVVIGSATGPIATELLKYPGVTVEAVELDPAVSEVLARHVEPPPPAPTATADGRAWLRGRAAAMADDPRREEAGFDLIYLAVGDPTSIAAGRFYTREFFDEAAACLAPGGVLAMGLSGPPGQVSPQLAEYLGSIQAALGQSRLSRTLWTWSDPTMVFAARSEDATAAPPETPITANADELARRYRARGGPADFDPDYFLGWTTDRLRPSRLMELRMALSRAGAGRANTDGRPVAMLLHLARMEQSLTASPVGPAGEKPRGLLELVQRVRPWWAVAAVAAAAVAAAVWTLLARRRGGGARPAAMFSLATVGLTGMALSVILLAGYQSLCGVLYSRIALIVGVYMVGVAIGSGWFSRRGPVERGRRWAWRRLLWLEVGLLIGCRLVPIVLNRLVDRPVSATGSAVAEAVILAMISLAGLAGGAAVPLVTEVLRSAGSDTARAAAAVDAADCLGGAIGAVACGLILLPLMGWTAACMVLTGLAAAAAGVLLLGRPGK